MCVCVFLTLYTIPFKCIYSCSVGSIHDRKMSVIGLCSLLQCHNRPPVIQSNAAVIVPLIIQQLDLLVAAYRS